MSDTGFIRREVDGIPFYVCRTLESVTGLRHCFSTRSGGVSALPANSLNLSYVDWDSIAAVDENRRRLMTSLNLESMPLATLSQIHSDRVHIIEEKPNQGNDRPRADALATQLRGVALGVQVADCFPVLIADRAGGGIAAVHAGWRGSVQRIAARAVAALRSRFGARPTELLAAIGPGIRGCCFEVGPEVSARFEEQYPGMPLQRPNPANPSRALLDLPQALRLQLAEAGVRASHIFDAGLCTKCNAAEFFSYRGEGPRSGRLMAVIARHK